MLKKERQAYILHQLNLHNKIVSVDLSNEIAVSEDTIRRDLQELSETGQLIKVHGGALSTAFNEVQFKAVNVYSQSHKKIIVNKALELIKNGMFILTSGGTTILELIRALPPHLKLTIMTGSIPVINACMAHPKLDVVVIGDKLSRDSKITVGAEAIQKISNVNADLCFLGTNAIDVAHGVTDNDWEVVQIKRAMVSSSSKVISMTISEKLQTYQPISVCKIERIDYLITELDSTDEKLKLFADAGVYLL
ncbi:DeoR/GlpR family DNA-binding transcription regulator [Niabella ginsengisoli]|uniref:DeoR/GlpR family DNA-binding transcription regulator n=1 Tax=Niabella ginsengisoli TaxID=522298 RepID=A0ABS9SEN2_9BACT|nr:DeoR/GlpR family DNA-binding transcription regulator [Niabella ginsengisoli]MCH5596820.1 DeoR/GlpR family DNA-binding transcription regulator [Niabella ginsengisoli]